MINWVINLVINELKPLIVKKVNKTIIYNSNFVQYGAPSLLHKYLFYRPTQFH